MGGKSSKAKNGGTDEPKKKGEEKEERKEEKARPDPSNFYAKNLQHATVCKAPGSLAGQQFVIRDCEDCDIFVCDNSSCVTVDGCVDCRIFFGAIDGSCFVRTSKNCKFVVACQQWRTRQCSDCDILLSSDTQPTIESSSNLRFGCYQAYYPELLAQFTAANLNVFHNEWSNMFDFTAAERNWTFLPAEVTVSSLLKPFPEEIKADLSRSVVPLTWGDRPNPPSEQRFFLVVNKDTPSVVALLDELVVPKANYCVFTAISGFIDPHRKASSPLSPLRFDSSAKGRPRT
eukprot:TRINITY_DN1032_c0_g1_i1.p1 TRINITY_DN1032_c0_g1~~TRINITY_DN1032_c0_g1_i1.p1  ORF type:complete len:288 (-),score=63.11 TRINITY_DN1032_c0_g1_i1:274-1137(-)